LRGRGDERTGVTDGVWTLGCISGVGVHKTKDGTIQIQNKQLAGFVFSERRNLECGVEQNRLDAILQHENFARAQISVDICAIRQAGLRAAVHIASDDRASSVGPGIDVVGNRGNETGRRTRGGAETGADGTFPNAPAVVASLCNNIDFLPSVLSDIANIKLPSEPIE